MMMKANDVTEKTGWGKRMKLGAAALFLACVIAVTSAGMALAGGGINHKTKVKNSSGKSIEVTFVYSLGADEKHSTISNGSSHTFESGAKCPVGLEGWVPDDKVKVITRCIIGTEKGSSSVKSSCGAVSCYSTDWNIKKHSDGLYHFDKD
jgi:hypothetical protein